MLRLSRVTSPLLSLDSMSPEAPVVGAITHHSIALKWGNEEAEHTGPPEDRTLYTLEQIDSQDKCSTVYVGYGTQFIAEDLEPSTEYKFRLRITSPDQEMKSDEEHCESSVVSATTCWEPRCGLHLHEAVINNDQNEMMRVLESGTANVNSCDSLGFTPLMVAVQKGYDRLLYILVEHGADIHLKNSSGKDCLMLACFTGNLEIVKYLRSLGASWQSRDMSGCTSLHCAVDGGHLSVIEYMIRNGCEVDVRETVSQWTPLMRVSAVSGNTDVAELLIKAGADINVRDDEGKTPLMLAVLNSHLELVGLLLENGADKHVKNKFGSDIIDMAKASEKQNMINLLKGIKS